LKLEVHSAVVAAMKEFYDDFELIAPDPPTESWFNGFKERNLLATRRETTIEEERVENANSKVISDWFDNIFTEDILNDVPPCMIANLDETMLQTYRKEVVVVRRSSSQGFTSKPSYSEHITILSLVTASGDKMMPLFIFQLHTLPSYLDRWVRDKQMLISGQKNGWIDKTTFKSYCVELVKFAKQQRIKYELKEDVKFFVFLDSHSSREDSETMDYLKNNNVEVVALPSHCSHVLQVLDLWLHMRFKCLFMKERRTVKREIALGKIILGIPDDNETVKMRTIHVIAAMRSLHCTMMADKIYEAFARAGIWPRDKNKALSIRQVAENDAPQPLDLTLHNRCLCRILQFCCNQLR